MEENGGTVEGKGAAKTNRRLKSFAILMWLCFTLVLIDGYLLFQKRKLGQNTVRLLKMISAPLDQK